ncbi:hypothetical protein G8A07_10990 [Roseateles sp. DAIF2]|uniref:hypothetical protein n=1 Tax=Roseateles sp. DAIF2 TaxID=2714952 RepID=UPI0018A33AEA|nr:hypothetical protein [Roseateles sp. DAIF2]QPF73390.1 hypothetical protein G8A07_10990 [Roseateles sp. DAIF2]
MSAVQPVQRIARLPSEGEPAYGFATLRARALDWVQQASGAQWTDYNLHDPGVTLLETLVYALTEEIYAAQDEVPALLGLGAEDPDAAARRFALHGPEAVLRHRPCSALDQLAWLHAQQPAPRHADLSALEDGAGRPLGLWSWRQLGPDRQPPAALRRQAAALAQRYWRQRNLGEDLCGLPELLRPHWVRLQVELEVDEDHELIGLLGELVRGCDRFLAAMPEPAGPHLPPPADELLRVQSGRLYVSDLARALRRVPGLRSIERLLLSSVDPAQPTPAPAGAAAEPEDAQALLWRGPGWGMRLCWPERAADLEGWKVRRGGALLPLPAQELLHHLQDLRRAGKAGAAPLNGAVATGSTPGRPAVAPEPVPRYDPASRQLPEVYREPLALRWSSEQPTHLPPGQRAQWAGYLALLEHPLAQLRAQRLHLDALYDIENPDPRSYWCERLNAQQLPGIEALYLPPAGDEAHFGSDLLAGHEPGAERRARALDQLLALHGEQLDPTPLQDLPRYLDESAWALRLLDAKRRYARLLLDLTGERHAGFDYSQPGPEREPERAAPLQRRLALQLALLGGPLLSQPLQEAGLLPLEPPPRPPSPATLTEPEDEAWQVLTLTPGDGAEPAEPVPLAEWLGAAGGDAALLRAAAQPQAFACRAEGSHWLLRVGPDAEGRSWPLGRFASAEAAARRAQALLRALCRLQLRSEGLHLVEHLLLRPGAADQRPETLDDFFRQHLTLVLPGWTARCADPRLRSLAEARLLEAAPAQLRCQLLWLGAASLQRFETLWQAWLLAKRAHCQALLEDAGVAGAQRRVDERAATLVAWLRGRVSDA